MIKICDVSIWKPPELIIGWCLGSQKCPLAGKKHLWFQLSQKKKDEQIVENYHPISFLSIVGEILQRILYNMFEFITENNLTFPN